MLAQREMCREINLFDLRAEAAAGAALDIMQCASYFGFDTQVRGGDDVGLIRDSDLVIITAGSPRKPGMSRGDVLDVNRAVIDAIVDQILEHAPNALLMLVTNPVDILTWHAWKHTGWERNRVFGLGGVLDTARMSYFIAQETGHSSRDIQTMVIGGHGDSMLPLFRFSSIHGISAEIMLDSEVRERISERTRHGGAQVLNLREDSSAFNAPAAAIATMVDAICNDRKQILPCVSILDGEYRQHDTTAGVPRFRLAPNPLETIRKCHRAGRCAPAGLTAGRCARSPCLPAAAGL
jgi:malate dehydrogenase